MKTVEVPRQLGFRAHGAKPRTSRCRVCAPFRPRPACAERGSAPPAARPQLLGRRCGALGPQPIRLECIGRRHIDAAGGLLAPCAISARATGRWSVSVGNRRANTLDALTSDAAVVSATSAHCGGVARSGAEPRCYRRAAVPGFDGVVLSLVAKASLPRGPRRKRPLRRISSSALAATGLMRSGHPDEMKSSSEQTVGVAAQASFRTPCVLSSSSTSGGVNVDQCRQSHGLSSSIVSKNKLTYSAFPAARTPSPPFARSSSASIARFRTRCSMMRSLGWSSTRGRATSRGRESPRDGLRALPSRLQEAALNLGSD